jgi:hypothetical protein
MNKENLIGLAALFWWAAIITVFMCFFMNNVERTEKTLFPEHKLKEHWKKHNKNILERWNDGL